MPSPIPHTIHFDPNGGPLDVSPSAGQAAPGSYGLIVAEHDGLTLVPPSPFKGQFGVGSNTHRLPGSARDNDGRILDLVASVGLMDSTRAYAVHLTVSQDGKNLGTVSDVGVDTGTGRTHESDILVTLSGAPAVMAINASLASLISAPKSADRVPPRTSRRAAVRKATRAAGRVKSPPRKQNRKGPKEDL